jgi:hypothetical protein
MSFITCQPKDFPAKTCHGHFPETYGMISFGNLILIFHPCPVKNVLSGLKDETTSPEKA